AGLEQGKVFGKGVQGEEPFFRKVFPLVAEGSRWNDHKWVIKMLLETWSQ
ncbi:hypothetical protein SAMN02745704_02878, partial [Paucidesulfovibrio gracilis DSM 16080]